MSSLGVDLRAAVRHKLKQVLYAFLPAGAQEAIDRRFYYRRLSSGALSAEAEFRLLPSLVRPGEIALDVGANLGGYTIALSRLVGPTGQVHAFEPIPRTFRLLTYNVSGLAPYANVGLHPTAVGNSTDLVDMEIPTDGKLGNYYVARLAHGPSADRGRVRVPLISLDAWEPLDGRPISFVKIDVEGAEWEVLDGARALLRRHRPVVLCELGDAVLRFGHTPQDVFALVAECGSSAYRFVAGRLRSVTKPDGLPLPNYLFVPPEREERIRSFLVAP